MKNDWLERIILNRKKLEEGYAANPRHFSGLKQDLTEDRYNDPCHFIYELIQNADDQNASNVYFEINNYEIMITHNGKNFTEQDVDDITTPRNSKKVNDPKKIGKYGIGFFSVYSICDSPIIYSSINSENFFFKIKEIFWPEKLNLEETNKYKNRVKKNNTYFFLKFKKNIQNEFLKEIENFIQKNSKNSLLFLRYINNLTFKINKKTYEYKKRERGLYTYLTFNENNLKNISKYLIYSKFTDQNIGQGELMSFAFKMNKQEFIPEEKYTNFYVYFPTDQLSTFQFIINSPFALDSGRSLFKKNNNINNALLNQCANEIENIFEFLKEKKILNFSFLKLLGYRLKINEAEDISANIAKKIGYCFKYNEVWPTTSQEFSKIDNLYLLDQSLKKSKYFNSVFSDINISFVLQKKKIFVLKKIKKEYEKLYIDFNGNIIDKNFIINLLDNDFKIFTTLSKKNGNNWLSKLYLFLSELNYNNHHFPLIKSSINQFKKGSNLRFKNHIKLKKINYVHDFFIKNKNLSNVEIKKLRKFFEILGVTEVDDFDQINEIIFKYYSLDKNKKLTKKIYSKHINLFLHNFNESKYKFNFKDKKIFLDKNFDLRNHNELFIDDQKFQTNLSLIYQNLKKNNKEIFHKEMIYIPDMVNISHFIKFAKDLGVEFDYNIERAYIFNNPDLKQGIYVQGRPTGNMQSIKEDYNLPNLEYLNLQNINISKFIAKKLNLLESKYFKSKYSKSYTSSIIEGRSSFLCFLDKSSWVPNKNGIFFKLKDLTPDTIDKKFFKIAKKYKNTNWLKLLNFGENKEAKYKKLTKLIGSDKIENWKIFEELNYTQINYLKSLKNEKQDYSVSNKLRIGRSHKKRKINKLNIDGPPIDTNWDFDNNINNHKLKKSKSNTKRNSELVKIMKTNYHNHCQICLTEQSVDILSPKKSYIEFLKDRSSIINIHHVKPLAQIHGGLDELGNVVSLCLKHHSEYGEIIDYDLLKKSLINGGVKFKCPWEIGVKGSIISTNTLVSNKSIKIYFRDDHLKKWIE